MRVFSGILLAMLSAAASAADKPLVRWLTMDFPPYHIQDGTDAGTGTHDRFLRRLQEELPEFTHVVEPSSSSRMEALMKSGAPACSVSKIKTPERQAFSLFSQKPYFSVLPLRLVTLLPGDALLSGANQEAVSLDDLLQRRVVSLGLLDTRRHGLEIDRIVSRAPEGQVFRFKADPLLSRSLTMIERGRFNATLGYSVEINYLQRTGKIRGEFRYFPLKESDPLIHTYVSCSQSAIGRRVIDAVNRLPENRASIRELAADYEAWLPDDERRRFAALRAQQRD